MVLLGNTGTEPKCCNDVMKISRFSSWNMSCQVRIAVIPKNLIKKNKNLKFSFLLFKSDRGFTTFAHRLERAEKMFIKYTQFR